MKFFLSFFLVIAFLGSSAQKKKEVRKHGIKTVTTTQTYGKKTVMDSKLSFNANGLLIEEIKYDSTGKFTSLTRYKYNASEDVTEEAEFDSKNKLLEKRLIKYNILEQKTEELVVDLSGKQVKKNIYTYNSKGLRSEKKTYNSRNILISTKKNTYTYN